MSSLQNLRRPLDCLTFMALENPIRRAEVRDFFPREYDQPSMDTIKPDWSCAATPQDQYRARKWRERVIEMRKVARERELMRQENEMQVTFHSQQTQENTNKIEVFELEDKNTEICPPNQP